MASSLLKPAPWVTFEELNTVAVLHIPPGFDGPTELLMEIIAATGISHGFDEPAFIRASLDPTVAPLVIARGCKPIAGRDLALVIERLEAEIGVRLERLRGAAKLSLVIARDGLHDGVTLLLNGINVSDEGPGRPAHSDHAVTPLTNISVPETRVTSAL